MSDIFECIDPNGVPFSQTNNYVDKKWAMKKIAALEEENALMLEDIGHYKKVIENLSRDWLHWKGRCEQFIEENARLREALKPFVPETQWIDPDIPDTRPIDVMVLAGEIRAARAAIREGGEG